MRLRIGFTVLLAIGLVFSQKLFAGTTSISVDTLTNLIDANAAPFNQIQPGDTVLFEPGRRDFILIRNFSGAEGYPIVFINKNGLVTIDTDHYFGISIQNCRFIRLTGTGSEANFYGFRITRVQNGAGIGVNDMSSDFEIDHVSIENTMIGGIYAKTDPDCSLAATRDKFTQFNTLLHDNYIANVGDEGMYIGSTKFFGQTVACNGTDTLLLPALLDGVRIYNNIIRNTGWDGIQVSSASSGCQVYDNLVMYDSQEEHFGQMSGIMLGGGSKCDCYNNYISSGKGSGIESHGLGGYRIFNNIIVDAGRSYQPLDTSLMKYGIYVTDISVQADSAFYILHNDIINPKSDGIRFLSMLSKNNLVASNLVINPGNYDYYENGGTGFNGMDSYIMLPDAEADVTIKNNYLSRTAENGGFSAVNYTLLPGSPLIDSAYADSKGIVFDFYHHPRPYGIAADIGAFEYNPAYLGIPADAPGLTVKPILFPNPVRTLLNIQYQVDFKTDVFLDIYNLQGSLVQHVKQVSINAGIHTFKIDVEKYEPGIFLYTIRAANYSTSGRFIKVN